MEDPSSALHDSTTEERRSGGRGEWGGEGRGVKKGPPFQAEHKWQLMHGPCQHSIHNTTVAAVRPQKAPGRLTVMAEGSTRENKHIWAVTGSHWQPLWKCTSSSISSRAGRQLSRMREGQTATDL